MEGRPFRLRTELDVHSRVGSTGNSRQSVGLLVIWKWEEGKKPHVFSSFWLGELNEGTWREEQGRRGRRWETQVRCWEDASSGELSGLWNEPVEGPRAMEREQCVVWGEEAETREAQWGLGMMQGSQQRLGRREERPGPRAGQSHGDRAVLSLTPTPVSCPIPFPLRWGEVLDLSWDYGRLTSQGRLQQFPVCLLKHVLCSYYLTAAWSGQPRVIWVIQSLPSSHLWQRAHILCLLPPVGQGLGPRGLILIAWDGAGLIGDVP